MRVEPSQIVEHRNKRRPRELSFGKRSHQESRHVQARFDRAARARARRFCRAGADFNFSRRHPRPCGSPHVVRTRIRDRWCDRHLRLELRQTCQQGKAVHYRHVEEAARRAERVVEVAAPPLVLQSAECWLLGLIVYELITNAVRHAFHGRNGEIRVELLRAGAFVHCKMMDNGSAPAHVRRGHGLRIIQELVKALDGRFEQRFGTAGSTSILVFPYSQER
jgi:anti-sigma regulatory factor (Ser/Thr protein kinase)